jgi:steroid 5-alpha reductase family enzyme
MQGPLRIIFSLTVLAFWALFGIGLATGSWTAGQWVLLAIGHAVCLVIFRRFVHVFTYGYSVTMVLGPLAVLAMAPTPAAFAVTIPAMLFGLRLTAFIRNRNRSASYAASVRRQQESDAAVALPFRAFMWVAVSWLMAFELMPLLFVARAGAAGVDVIAGAAVMLAGLAIEGVADAQKQAEKGRDPAAFAREGLYRISRHPNYLGEIVFQAGVLVASVGAVSGPWQFLAAVLAPLYIITLMSFAGLEADRAQQQRYGSDPAYLRYRASTGCFLPGL